MRHLQVCFQPTLVSRTLILVLQSLGFRVQPHSAVFSNEPRGLSLRFAFVTDGLSRDAPLILLANDPEQRDAVCAFAGRLRFPPYSFNGELGVCLWGRSSAQSRSNRQKKLATVECTLVDLGVAIAGITELVAVERNAGPQRRKLPPELPLWVVEYELQIMHDIDNGITQLDNLTRLGGSLEDERAHLVRELKRVFARNDRPYAQVRTSLANLSDRFLKLKGGLQAMIGERPNTQADIDRLSRLERDLRVLCDHA